MFLCCYLLYGAVRKLTVKWRKFAIVQCRNFIYTWKANFYQRLGLPAKTKFPGFDSQFTDSAIFSENNSEMGFVNWTANNTVLHFGTVCGKALLSNPLQCTHIRISFAHSKAYMCFWEAVNWLQFDCCLVLLFEIVFLVS